MVIQKSTTAPDPHAIFCQHLVSRDALFPLFPQLWLRSNGTVPSRSWFMSRLHRFFPRSIGGHSMRASGATSLVLQMFLLPRSKPLADGSQTPSSVIFVATLRFCRQCCFMVGPFMILPLLANVSVFSSATFSINLSLNFLFPFSLPSLPFNTFSAFLVASSCTCLGVFATFPQCHPEVDHSPSLLLAILSWCPLGLSNFCENIRP